MLFVHEKTMRLFTMLSETLTMISAEDNQSVLVKSLVLEKLDQPPELRICKSDSPS
jgi:hypothetical protein